MSDDLDPVIAAAVDRFASEQHPPLSREAAVAYILKDWLISMRLIPLEPEPEEGE